MNFLKVSCFLSSVFCLLSCKPIDIKNEQHFSDVVSIVVFDNDIKYIKNSYSTFLAQGLDTIQGETCGFASYIVNYDEQPAITPPFEADLISWKRFDVSSFQYMSGSILDTYKETMLSISSVLNLNQFMFLTVDQKTPEDYIYNYELLCCKDSVDKNDIITMYLKTKLGVQGIDTVPVNRKSMIAFNIFPFLEDQIKQGNDSLIQFNIKYSSKTDPIGNPVYSSYKSNPVKIKHP